MGAAQSCGVWQADLEKLAGTESVAGTDDLWARVELCEISAGRKDTANALNKVLSRPTDTLSRTHERTNAKQLMCECGPADVL